MLHIESTMYVCVQLTRITVNLTTSLVTGTNSQWPVRPLCSENSMYVCTVTESILHVHACMQLIIE